MDSRSQGRDSYFKNKCFYHFTERPCPQVNNVYRLKRDFVSLQALRARYEGRTREEAFHLVKARHWSLGHNVILRSLASDAIINGRKIKYNDRYTTNDI